jgi:hypothetical protein
MDRTRFSLALVLASLLAACATGSQASRGGADDDDDDGGDTATSGGGGTTGSGGGSAHCQGYCAKEASAACALENAATCEQECIDGRASVPLACTGQYDTLLACAAGPGSVSCDAEGTAQIAGCDAEFETVMGCIQGSPSSGAGGGSGCYDGLGACSPLTPSCAAGEACDVSSTNAFECFPPPNDVPTGGTCDNAAGPYCQHGNFCDTGVCRRYCCTSTDCATGTCEMAATAGGIVVQVCR